MQSQPYQSPLLLRFFAAFFFGLIIFAFSLSRLLRRTFYPTSVVVAMAALSDIPCSLFVFACDMGSIVIGTGSLDLIGLSAPHCPQPSFALEKSISGCCSWNFLNISNFFCSSLVGFPISFCR